MGQRRNELLQRAQGLPAMRSQAESYPLAIKAQGARIYDVDNIGYIDYVAGGGGALLGYANPFVLDAVRKVLASGVPNGVHIPQEVDLADSLGKFLPWADSWWFCRGRDEAMEIALTSVRRITGKDGLLALDGGMPLPSSLSGRIHDVPGWDLERIEIALTAGASQIAALVVDPQMSGVGVVPPPPDALPRLAEMCRSCEVLLILDERTTGFRINRGGAAAWTEVTPDLAVYADPLGAGFPIGLVAFGEAIDASVLAEEGIASHHAPHPLAVAAAEAVLSILKNETVYERLEERTEQLAIGILEIAERCSRPIVVNRLGSAYCVYMTDEPVRDCASVERADGEVYCELARSLLGEGVLMPQMANVPAYVSGAHGAKDVDETLAAFERVLQRLRTT